MVAICTSPDEEMPMEKMANRLLDLIKGTNLYTQE
jgi:hypothetical protein